ncbi:MAG: hypothetical protein HYY78_07180 [Betaproteobacteria bacterium]|nr:hypothetical protein [Betaproteobacteria bacterium]
MTRTVAVVFSGILSILPGLAVAQQQVVKPPVANYWVSVETAGGMSMPGMGSMGALMGGMMGGQGQGGRKMSLQLGSQRPADGPRADHMIPSGMEMGPSLPLATPQRAPAQPRERGERGTPEGMEQPKGRMLIYWGCGENVRAGQPVIIDFAALPQGQTPPNMVSRRVSIPNPPSFSRARTYGDWPNPQDSKSIPGSASLKGDHQIKGNYSPDIQFSLGEGHDFMDRVELATAARGAGAVHVTWNAVGTATGYFATVFGSDGTDTVMWSSSDVQEMGGMLMNFVPPAEVARLVREQVVLAPSVTECAVPADVVKRSGGSPFLNFIAYGPEANFAQPPRPKDPRQPWEPLWAVKVRFKSTASTLLGEAAGGGGRRPARTQAPGESPSGEASESQTAEPAQKPAAPDPLKEGVNILRGIFGR